MLQRSHYEGLYIDFGNLKTVDHDLLACLAYYLNGQSEHLGKKPAGNQITAALTLTERSRLHN